MVNILFVEDDQGLNEGVSFGLQQKGYGVRSFTHGLVCLQEVAKQKKKFDIAILDVSLPDIDGFTLAKRLSLFYHIPIVFLTAKDEEVDVLKGYELGCEDYITKPFSLPVLLEKIKVIVRRSHENIEEHIYTKGYLYFDFEKKVFKKGEEALHFTVKEALLLDTLIQHKNQILTKEQLLKQVWDIDGEFVDENTLSVNIRRLRKKIEEEPKNAKWIKTIFGIGYKWCDI